MSDGRIHSVSYDADIDVLTFDGFKFSGELMRQCTETPCGRMFRIVSRDGGIITISQEEHPLAKAAPDMLAALKLTVPVLEAVQRIFVRYGLDDGKIPGGPLNDIISSAIAKAEPIPPAPAPPPTRTIKDTVWP